jgi:F-type H+-transporting ATPase subunit b
MRILAAEAHNPLVPPVGEIIIGLVAFAILFFVVAKFVAPRFEQVFRARREAIEGGIERAEAMQAEAKAALERYQAQLAVNQLRGEIGALAVDLAGRVVGESLEDQARRSGTVDRFLDQLDGMAAGASPDGRGGATGSSVYVPQGDR